jgi:diaminopimelate decarboxylase
VSRVAHPAGPRHGDVLPADHPPTPPANLNELDPAIWPRGAHRVGGVLTLGGIDVRDLAARFGTPALIMDEADVRGRAREYVDAFGEDAQVYYASKAFCSRAVLRWVTEEGLGVDVCTGGGRWPLGSGTSWSTPSRRSPGWPITRRRRARGRASLSG